MKPMETISQLSRDEVLSRVRELAGKYARLISITCVDVGQLFELIYVFEDELKMVCFKTEVPHGTTFPSISSLYPGAMLAENEIRDQFGLQFDGIAIDFGGYMFLSHDSPRKPFIKEVRVKGAMKKDEGESG